jgi:hypothetical protein
VLGAIAAMLPAASTTETTVNFYQTTRSNNPEDSHLHTRRREKLKSQLHELSVIVNVNGSVDLFGPFSTY